MAIVQDGGDGRAWRGGAFGAVRIVNEGRSVFSGVAGGGSDGFDVLDRFVRVGAWVERLIAPPGQPSVNGVLEFGGVRWGRFLTGDGSKCPEPVIRVGGGEFFEKIGDDLGSESDDLLVGGRHETGGEVGGGVIGGGMPFGFEFEKLRFDVRVGRDGRRQKIDQRGDDVEGEIDLSTAKVFGIGVDHAKFDEDAGWKMRRGGENADGAT